MNVFPKLLHDRQAYRGVLHGFEQSGRDLITAQVGANYLLLPKSLEKRLEAHLEQSVEIAKFGEKHCLRPFDPSEFSDRQMSGAAIDSDLVQPSLNKPNFRWQVPSLDMSI